MRRADTCTVEVDGLTKVFSRPGSKGEGKVVALAGVHFRATPGEIVALVGPNGAGKTTILKSIAGLVRPSRGSVTVTTDGTPIKRVEPYVSLLLEGTHTMYGRLTVRENLAFFGGLEGGSRRRLTDACDRVITALQLDEKADVPAQQLSRGMRQKLSLACVLVRDTPVLLLDEPTLGLDAETQRDLERRIVHLASEGCTIIICSHDFRLVEAIASRVVVLKNGSIVSEGDPRRLRSLPDAPRYEIVVQSLADGSLDDIDLPGVRLIATHGDDLHFELQAGPEHDLWSVMAKMACQPVRLISVRMVGYDLSSSLQVLLNGEA